MRMKTFSFDGKKIAVQALANDPRKGGALECVHCGEDLHEGQRVFADEKGGRIFCSISCAHSYLTGEEEAREKAATPVRRASYREGVKWIAYNDDPGSPDAKDPAAVASYISTLLLADLFGKEPEVVAADIIRLRIRWDLEAS